MKPRPTVSVIVPCYNAAQTLSATIASVQAQTHQNWELVCVDDGSTDRTPQLLDALAAPDARIRWLRSSNGGPGAARNRGVACARADRVFFLDADDLLRRDALEALLRTSAAAGDATIVTAGAELLDRDGRPLSLFQFPTVPEFTIDAFLRGNRISVLTLVPLSVLDHRPFDETLRTCEDWDLWLRLADRHLRCLALPRILFGYRLQGGSLSHRADVLYQCGRRVLERWLPRARQPERVRDAFHRHAFTCGALALAAGSPDSIWDYFADLPPLDVTDEFVLAAAAATRWAFLFVQGAAGATWRSHADDWLADVAEWLGRGPLATHADSILACLRATTRGPGEYLELVRALIARRSGVRRVVVYGLGTNGLSLVELLRSDSGAQRWELHVADDGADPLAFATLGLARDDPRRWKSWPKGTVVIVTPSDPRPICRVLLDRGGRPAQDFITLVGELETVTVPAG